MARRSPIAAILAVVLVFTLCIAGVAASGTAIRQVSGPDGTSADEFAVGTRLTVEGMTNLRPDEHVIVVELRNEGGDVAAAVSADRWSYDGTWNVTVDTSGFAPGAYTVVADDGYDTDFATVRLVRPTETPSPTPTRNDDPGFGGVAAAVAVVAVALLAIRRD
ncbi:MAG: PGF-CTERM sorting domain-containing protein [Halobacterium sp.]